MCERRPYGYSTCQLQNHKEALYVLFEVLSYSDILGGLDSRKRNVVVYANGLIRHGFFPELCEVHAHGAEDHLHHTGAAVRLHEGDVILRVTIRIAVVSETTYCSHV